MHAHLTLPAATLLVACLSLPVCPEQLKPYCYEYTSIFPVQISK